MALGKIESILNLWCDELINNWIQSFMIRPDIIMHHKNKSKRITHSCKTGPTSRENNYEYTFKKCEEDPLRYSPFHQVQ